MELCPFTIIQTNDNKIVEDKIKQYASDNDYEFFSFAHKREDLDAIRKLYLSSAKAICFIKNIDKSLVSDALLKLCEAGRKDFIVVATVTIINEGSPLIQRARVVHDFNNNTIDDLIKSTIEFIKSKQAASKKDILDRICLSEKDISEIYPTTYLKELAQYFAKNISLANADNIQTIAKVFSAYILNPNTLFMKAMLDDMLEELKC